MTVTTLEVPRSFDDKLAEVDRAAGRNRVWTFGFIGLVILYFAGSWIQFDLGSVINRWNSDRAALFVLDTYAHKDHISMRWKEPEEVVVAFEGGHRNVYDPHPDWMRQTDEGGSEVSFDNGGTMTIFRDRVEMANWPDTAETFVFRRDRNDKPYVEGYRDRLDELPDWIRATENKVEVRPSLFERLQVYKSKVEIHRYEVGWKYFWFDFDSPLSGTGFFGAIGLILSGDRVDPEQSNLSLVLYEFLDNNLWHHGTVLFAMLETVLMALIGTMFASLIGLPLAFIAARNVMPFAWLRFATRRLFDFLRGVDTLIWSLIFLRAFGPGLFTGMFAIAFTDTGTLGKLMSEAIENADNKQVEGVQSTGAKRVQRYRFGILPQIMPVFISQSLYYLESNTRSATIIGAMGAGGIGLQFLGALQTGNDFENVAYIALLVLLTVVAMDALSAWLRRMLIGYEKDR
ncbi:MAG: phosphonate ABC transporter, permease protein PhnE [Pseudomonadota bacterium]